MDRQECGPWCPVCHILRPADGIARSEYWISLTSRLNESAMCCHTICRYCVAKVRKDGGYKHWKIASVSDLKWPMVAEADGKKFEYQAIAIEPVS